MTIRAALYARVSTDEQDPELQIRELQAVAERRGWSVVGLYVDRGVSGSRESRPELDRLMRATREGKVDVVACWKFDRFARSVKHLVTALDEFMHHQVDFVSITEAVDTATPAGRMLFSVIAAFAEFEKSVLKERVHAGLRRARAQGKRLGRPPRATTAQAEDVRRQRAAGRSWRTIAMSVGLPTSTVRDLCAPGRDRAST